MLFEQMIREILKEGNEGDGARRTETGITKNSKMVGIAASGAEARIGIKHWYPLLEIACYLSSTESASLSKQRVIPATGAVWGTICIPLYPIPKLDVSCHNSLCHILGSTNIWKRSTIS